MGADVEPDVEPEIGPGHTDCQSDIDPGMGCSFPDCDRPHYSGGYCAGHYQQNRRGQELKPLRTSPGEGDKVQVSVPRELREAAQKEATAQGVTESAWWKVAGEERLARSAKKPKAK